MLVYHAKTEKELVKIFSICGRDFLKPAWSIMARGGSSEDFYLGCQKITFRGWNIGRVDYDIAGILLSDQKVKVQCTCSVPFSYVVDAVKSLV